MTAMPDFAAQRLNMVEAQIRTNHVTDPRILQAMLELPREAFVPSARRAAAYADACVDLGKGRALLDPRSFAKLVQAAEIGEGETVLDLGCATGYSTAVLARLAARVTGLEEDAGLLQAARTQLSGSANVGFALGPLAAGWPAAAPYDVIVLNGSVDFVPDGLFAQLNEDGRLVCVMRRRAGGQAMVYTRHDGAIGDRAVFDADVPPLPGFERRQGFVF
jgi:protein-L-isoaspartate(D-aspartate) O-methyltransferase